MNARAVRRRRSRYCGVIRAALGHAPMCILAVAVTIPTEVAVAAESSAMVEVSFRVVADGIPEPLASGPSDSARGRGLIVARDAANCVLCHAVPDAAVRFAGDLGPSLAGIGGRLTASQLRLRVADNRRLYPATIMPSYFTIDGLDRVAPAYRGKPILSAAEIEDVVAYLATMR